MNLRETFLNTKIHFNIAEKPKYIMIKEKTLVPTSVMANAG